MVGGGAGAKVWSSNRSSLWGVTRQPWGCSWAPSLLNKNGGGGTGAANFRLEPGQQDLCHIPKKLGGPIHLLCAGLRRSGAVNALLYSLKCSPRALRTAGLLLVFWRGLPRWRGPLQKKPGLGIRERTLSPEGRGAGRVGGGNSAAKSKLLHSCSVRLEVFSSIVSFFWDGRTTNVERTLRSAPAHLLIESASVPFVPSAIVLMSGNTD